MIPLCGVASAAEGETTFSVDPDRSETTSLQQLREVGQAGDKELKVQPHTHPICLEYLGYLHLALEQHQQNLFSLASLSETSHTDNKD